MYCCATLVVQLSFLAFYRRVFTFQNPVFKWAVLAVGAFAVCCWLSILFATIFLCTPVDFAWNHTIPNGHCGDPYALFISGLSLNLFTDLCIVLLPIPMVWRIKITRAEKWAVSGAFLLGGLSVTPFQVKALHLKKDWCTDVSFDLCSVCVGNLIRLPYLITANLNDMTCKFTRSGLVLPPCLLGRKKLTAADLKIRLLAAPSGPPPNPASASSPPACLASVLSSAA